MIQHKRTALLAAGQVQGVGFRPFIYRLAVEGGLSGSVGNMMGGHVDWMLLPALCAVQVVGLLGGVSVTGFAMAVFMSNAGGAWDNAKKYIESGHHGGKGSECHKAAVVGDTVGDPFKDTSGPSLNILIKLVSTVSIVFSGLIVAFHIL